MLFTLSNSPQRSDLKALVSLIGEGDALLLMQDGVVAALASSQAFEQLAVMAQPVYALREDLVARGLIGQISHKIILIDYTGFVALTDKHTPHIAW